MARLENARTLGRRSWLAGCLAGIGVLWTDGLTEVAAGETDQADTSLRSRQEAMGLLPLDRLTAETRRKLLAVCENPSIFRRLPAKTVDCDPDLHLFLIRNPEVVVNIWQVMGVSNMTAERTGPFTWKGDDGTGTICDLELVYGTEDLHIMYGDGLYEGGLLKRKITGRCVLILQSGVGQAADRRYQIGNRLDMFLQIDNAGADMIARTLAPWVGKVADTNFAESCKFASRLSQTAEANGPDMQRLADKLKQVEQPVREQFVRISINAQQRAVARDGAVRRG
jgi:hypothetical protein